MEASKEFNVETADLAYRESAEARNVLAQWYDALDSKIVAVFGVASAIVGLTPTLLESRPQGLSMVPWVIALLAWSVAAVASYMAFRPRPVRTDPEPKTLLNPAWLTLTPVEYKRFRLEDIVKTHRATREAYDRKTRAFAVSLQATAVEVLSLAIAVLLLP